MPDIKVRLTDDAGVVSEVTLAEASRTTLVNATSVFTKIKTAITDHASNPYTSDEAEEIALNAAAQMQAAGLIAAD